MVHFVRLRPEDQTADYGCRYVRSRGFLVRRSRKRPVTLCLTHRLSISRAWRAEESYYIISEGSLVRLSFCAI
jgi:hypothetical protein